VERHLGFQEPFEFRQISNRVFETSRMLSSELTGKKSKKAIGQRVANLLKLNQRRSSSRADDSVTIQAYRRVVVLGL